MSLQDIKKAIKENTPAIVTSVIVFLLVGFYLTILVPANEKQNDNINRSTLEEFNLQFNNTLKDYANQVDIDNLKDSIALKAGKLCLKCEQNTKDTSLLPVLNDLRKCDTSFILKNITENVILQSVRIDSVKQKGSELIIYKRVNVKFTPSVLEKCENANPKILGDLCCIRDTSHVDKEIMKKRLTGAISFKNWIIYSADNKQVFLNHLIDKEEFDSIKSTTSKSGVLSFKFSDKRFYRQSVAIEGTSNTFMLVGAINQTEFVERSKKVNLNSTFISALLVMLLLLSIPLIKPLISSRKEKQTQLDLLSTTFAIGLLAIVLVSFSFSQYLSNTYQDLSYSNLVSLNDSVSVKLNREFKPYYNALNMVNSKLEAKSEHPVHYDLDSLKFDSLAASYMGRLNKVNFQNFFTFNSKGDLVKDISQEGVFSIRRNFSERDYFHVLKEKAYSNMLTAVFSKYDNKFKFVYVRKNYITKESLTPKDTVRSKKNQIDTVDFSLSGFAFSPEFIEDFQFPVNSGYLLCNNTGRVILNSDMSKSLNEDIYAKSQKNYALSKMLHGMRDSIFELNYNGSNCLFYAKKYTGNILATTKTKTGKDSTYNAILNDYPLYLLTYKNLDYTNNLKVYTIINGFILSLAYVLAITFLVLLYSVFFYLGDISILSRYHLHWLFPDNSRQKEYTFLKWINYSAFTLFFILFIAGYKHVLYLAFLTGINLAFFNFVLLNQRVFLWEKEEGDSDDKIALKSYYLWTWGSLIVLFGYILPLICFHLHFASFGLSLSLLSHFIIIWALKMNKAKNALPDHKEVSAESTRPFFISYFSSVIAYHYILTPLLIIFSLFISEVNIVKDFNNSYSQKDIVSLESDDTIVKGILKTDGKVIAALPIEPPSKKYLEFTRFDNFKRYNYNLELKDFIRLNYGYVLLLVFSLVVIALFIRKLIDHYSGRFFFFELSEAYRLGYFKAQEPIKSLTNFAIIIPPYSKKDLEKLEAMEKRNDDIPKFIEQIEREGTSKVWLNDVPDDIVSNQVKVELIMMQHFDTYKSQYKALWETLSDEERFVMNDFAVDSFVNYKNRNVLMKLMEKGYVIADPLTGRLRVMNHGFRNFIIYLEINAPESAQAIKDEESNTKGTYSKWKLPLMIIAISGILMFMYLNKESFNNVLFIGGSAISAIGLIAKFLNAYKQ